MIKYDADFESRNNIKVGRQVSEQFNVGNFIITNNSHVKLRAGNTIEFSNGTMVNKGSYLDASIEAYPCPPVSSTLNNKSYNLNDEKIELQSEPDITEVKENSFYDFFTLINEDVIVYPNPNNGNFTIDIQNINEIRGDIQIFNSFGQQIKKIKTNKNIINVDISNNPKGIYFVKVISGNSIYTNKIIVQ